MSQQPRKSSLSRQLAQRVSDNQAQATELLNSPLWFFQK